MPFSRTAAIGSGPSNLNGYLEDDERQRYFPQPQPEQNRA